MKIALITSFAEFHLLECLIPNIIEIINPDKIVISEGKMPIGPENKGFHNTDEFNQKWTFEGKGIVGFDWLKTKLLEEKYKGLVEVREMKYGSDLSATECYIESITCDDFKVGDEIYCFESDSFLHENDIDVICQEVNRLEVGEGLSIKYVDFLETQHYTENINISQPKYRRFVYKFDNLENYQRKMGQGYLTQNYPELKRIESFFMRHYCWFRPNEYKELRYDLIKRNDQYWKDFESGLQQIRKASEENIQIESKFKEIGLSTFGFLENTGRNKIIIRPSRTDEGRWAKFIDISHPKHISNHPNFVK